MLARICRFHLNKHSVSRLALPSNVAKCRYLGNSVTSNGDSPLKYILALDFEATCDVIKIDQEIIEFPCLKICLETLQEKARFHHYVKPIVNPVLSTFCTELTGIIQDMVDNEKPFAEVLSLFEEWRKREGLTDENSLYITSGDWDLGHMMPRQCALSNLEVPSHMRQWIDIKKLYANNYNHYCNAFIDILRAFNLEFEGRKHSGIDDSLNISKVVKKLASLGIQFTPTSRLEITPSGKQVHIIGARRYNPGKV